MQKLFNTTFEDLLDLPVFWYNDLRDARMKQEASLIEELKREYEDKKPGKTVTVFSHLMK